MAKNLNIKMKSNYCHIGLGKCGTTFLQHKIFPNITKALDLKYIYPDMSKNDQEFKNFNKLKKEYKIYYDSNFKKLPEKEFDLNNYLISWESLISPGSFNPVYFENMMKFNKRVFGTNTHIIITVREPKTFLQSLYQQQIYHGHFLNIEEFLNIKSNKTNFKYSFNLNDFSYLKLINLYKNNFKHVSIIKFEDLSNLDLTHIFNTLDKDPSSMLNIEKKPLNRGLSSLSFKIIKFINIIFKANFAKKINQKLTYNSHETNLIFKIYNYVIQFIYYPNIFKIW